MNPTAGDGVAAGAVASDPHGHHQAPSPGRRLPLTTPEHRMNPTATGDLTPVEAATGNHPSEAHNTAGRTAPAGGSPLVLQHIGNHA